MNFEMDCDRQVPSLACWQVGSSEQLLRHAYINQSRDRDASRPSFARVGHSI